MEKYPFRSQSGCFFQYLSKNSITSGNILEIFSKSTPSGTFFQQISKNGAFHGTNMEIVAKALPAYRKEPLRDFKSQWGSNLCTILFSKELTNYVLLFFSVFFSAGGAGWHEHPMAQWLQLPPQEDFPLFLSRLMLQMIPATIASSMREIRIVPRLSEIQLIILSSPSP